MSQDAGEILGLRFDDFMRMPRPELQAHALQILGYQKQLRQDNQLLYYQPVNEKSAAVHTSRAQTIGIFGGNGSSKTEVSLVEAVIQATGLLPYSLREHVNLVSKFRGPINVRVVCESLTTVLHPIILPKLQYWKWTGVDSPGGQRGHWGWIPRASLVGGSWEKAWSEKLRMLRLFYRDPENPEEVMGESTIQFMSVDQDPTDFASGDFHLVIHDEPPSKAIWTENQARTMRVNGRMILAMTWPDDPGIAVDWIHDEIAEPGSDPTNTRVDVIQLDTRENPHLDQEAIAAQIDAWDETTVSVRISGASIRFSNRIHPLFTDTPDWWCFRCGTTVLEREGACSRCGSGNVVKFCHVEPFVPSPAWPTLWLVDPHPRKPHMMEWWQVDPRDDLWLVAERDVDGDPVDVARACAEVERELQLTVVARLIDPNMGRSPSGARRGVVWQDEFDAAGLRTDLADDSDVGRKRIDTYLKPDVGTLEPRIRVHPRCTSTIRQMKRYVWDEYRAGQERERKQTPKKKDDDHPTLWKYLLNSDPSFRQLVTGTQIVRHPRFGGRSSRRAGFQERVWQR